MFDGETHEGESAPYVVVDSLERVRLHKRNVLIRRRVKDDVGSKFPDDPLEKTFILDIGDVVADLLVSLQALPQEEDAVFPPVDTRDRFGVHPCNLPHQLRSDRPGRARDEHALALQESGGRYEVLLHRFAPHQVEHVDVGEVLDVDRLSRQDAVRPWDDRDLDVVGLDAVDEVSDGLGTDRRYGEVDDRNLPLGDHGIDVTQTPEHLGRAGSVVEVPRNAASALGDVSRQGLPRGAMPDDEDGLVDPFHSIHSGDPTRANYSARAERRRFSRYKP